MKKYASINWYSDNVELEVFKLKESLRGRSNHILDCEYTIQNGILIVTGIEYETEWLSGNISRAELKEYMVKYDIQPYEFSVKFTRLFHREYHKIKHGYYRIKGTGKKVKRIVRNFKVKDETIGEQK